MSVPELTPAERRKLEFYWSRGLSYLRQLQPPRVEAGDVVLVGIEPPFGETEYLPFEVQKWGATEGVFTGKLLALPEQGLAAFGMGRHYEPEDSLKTAHNWAIPRYAVVSVTGDQRSKTARLKARVL